MAVTLTNSQLSAGLYSAFWNRAPDATGQNFWVGNLNAGTPVLDIATAFYNAPEGLAAYPNWIRNDPAALVTQVYTSVFNRAPDAGGLAFYVAQINAGTSFPQVVLNMIDNALNAGNTDGQQFANEIQVGIYVSEVLRTDDPAVTGVALEGVTADPASVTVREAELYAMTHVGNTYTLTTGINDITGTPLNDTFNAPLSTIGSNTTVVNTLQASDYLDGNGGVDTLNAQLNDGVAINIDNIEIINATAVGGAVTLNLQNSAAVTDVNNNGSTGDLTVSGIAAGASNFGVADNGTKATTFTDTVGVVRTSANLFLENAGGTVTITSPTVNLVSDGTVANSITLTDTALTTLNVAGANAVTVAGLGATTTVVNGAASTGGLTAALATTSVGTIIGGAGNDSLTGGASNDVITGNAGNDTLTAGAGNDLITAGDGTDLIVFASTGNLTVADTVIGGLGTDTLKATSADLSGATYTLISGIDNVESSDVLGANLTLSNIQAGITGVVLDAGTGGKTITFDSGVNGTVTLNAAAGAAVVVTSAGTGITDSLTINSAVATKTDVLASNTISAAGVETLTLNLSTGIAQTQTVGAITGISGTTVVNINGSNNVTLTGAATAGSIDASGLTGTAAFSNADQATVGVTKITGSANNDTIVGSATATLIDGAAGNDTITGGAVADIIYGGAGNDVINGAAGNDIIHGDAGDDTITVTANTVSNVTIDGGAGNDTVVVNNTLAAGDSIDGGAGVNTFAQSTALIAAYAGVTNFSTLRLDAVMNQNVANFTGTNFTEIDATVAGTYNLSGLADTTPVHVVTGGSLVATHATDTAANTLTVGGYTAGGVTINAVTANDTNTLNVVDGETTTLQVNISSLNAAQVNQINLTGAIAKGLVVATSTDAVTGFGTAARTISVDGSANGAAVTFDGHTAAANQVLNVVGSAYNDGITGGLAADIINGGAGNDTIDGGAGNDSITGGVGNDAITGGSNADYLTGGLGVDTYVQAVTDSVLSTAQSTLAGTTIAAGQTITFANGVDVITDFLAGTGGDVINTVVATSSAAITAIGVANNALVVDNNYFFSGSYNNLTGVFTIAAAGTGADTLIMSTVTGTIATQNWATNQDAIVLIGVDSDNLVAGNFA